MNTGVWKKKSCMKGVIIKGGEQYYKYNKTSTLCLHKLLWKYGWTMYKQDVQRALFILKPHWIVVVNLFNSSISPRRKPVHMYQQANFCRADPGFSVGWGLERHSMILPIFVENPII